MRINFITLGLIVFIILNSGIYGQLEIKLETDKTEYQKEDSVIATYKIKNISNDAVIFINRAYITADKHCYGVYKYDDYVQMNRSDSHKLDNFLTINPLEEITVTKTLDIGWICRSAPPRGDWNIELICMLAVNDSDNYYITNDSENQKRKVNIFDAWYGSLVSNKVNIIIRRSD